MLRKRSSCGAKEDAAVVKAQLFRAQRDQAYEASLVTRIDQLRTKLEASNKRREAYLSEETNKVAKQLTKRHSLHNCELRQNKLLSKFEAEKARQIDTARRRRLALTLGEAEVCGDKLKQRHAQAAQTRALLKTQEECWRTALLNKQQKALERVQKVKAMEEFITKTRSQLVC